MIIRAFLKLFFASLIILILADLFYELHLRKIANLIIQLGDDVLLLSFALLIMTGIVFFAKHIIAALKDYFSETKRAERKLFFSIAKNAYLQRLFTAKKKQLLYFANLKRAALLAKNDKKQASLLAKSILAELNNLKNHFSETEFHYYTQAIKQAVKHRDVERLLQLQHEISSFHGR